MILFFFSPTTKGNVSELKIHNFSAHWAFLVNYTLCSFKSSDAASSTIARHKLWSIRSVKNCDLILAPPFPPRSICKSRCQPCGSQMATELWRPCTAGYTPLAPADSPALSYKVRLLDIEMDLTSDIQLQFLWRKKQKFVHAPILKNTILFYIASLP